MEIEPFRKRLRGTQFEIDQLLREFYRGDSIEKIAVRHQRTSLAIRARVIAAGAVDPSLRECQLRNRRTKQGRVTTEMLGLNIASSTSFPRDQLAWTEAEVSLASQSYREGLSLNAIAKVHRRHVLSIVCPIYEYFEDDRFELMHRSDEEAHLRFERLQQYADYCWNMFTGQRGMALT